MTAPRTPESVPAIGIDAAGLAALLARACPAHHLDLAGAVALPCPLPHADIWRSYVAEGRHGGLDYLARDPEARLDPTQRDPWAGALLVFAQRYTDGWPHGDTDPSAGGAAGSADDPAWTDLVLFHEYFHGETGKGLGAAHQTGWTGLVAPLIEMFGVLDPQQLLKGGKKAMYIRKESAPEAKEKPAVV